MNPNFNFPTSVGAIHPTGLERFARHLFFWAILISLGPQTFAQPLQGLVDMHAHPMAHLAYSGKFLHGAPDIGCLIPTDGECKSLVAATSIDHALGHCNATHGGYNHFTNPCGDIIRKNLIGTLEANNHAVSVHGKELGGSNTDFAQWPSCRDISHQAMWIDWIQRAHNNGLNVMVALAVNSETVAASMAGPGDLPTDDRSAGDLQISEIKKMVARHEDWMEIAYTSADLRRIVLAGKLAIVLGMEIDNIGNFNQQVKAGRPPKEAEVAKEINRLFDSGVRYIFPVHVIDNPFGGTAAFVDFFNISNYRESGECWQLEPAQASDSIDYQFHPALSQFMLDVLKLKIGKHLSLCPQSEATTPTPQVNARGLTPLGEFAVKEMMKLGMLIDVDHMSQKAANQTLDLAESIPGGYPVNSGHNGLRSMSLPGTRNENGRTYAQIRRILALQGMIGLGWGPDAAGFLKNLKAMMPLTGRQS
ncbi:MAG TPA: membrane dipeptidase, partial [Bacteroidia bacterium]|nr:membrane dipeptidase [Bacteroidia bacterium]